MKSVCYKFDEKRVTSLVEKGIEFHDNQKYAEALDQYQKAWQALPDPKHEWELANWIAACIYSAYFDLADYAEAKKWGETTLRIRGSDIDTAPLIDLGMVCYELNQFEEAYNILTMLITTAKSVHFRIDLKNILSFIYAKEHEGLAVIRYLVN